MKSLLYHAFGVKGYRYLRTRYEKGEIIFEIEPEEGPQVPGGGEVDEAGFSMAGCAHRGHRPQAGGAAGEGAALVEHDDGSGVRAGPPFVDAYTKITRKLAALRRIQWL